MKWTRIEAILETNELIQNWMLDINPKKYFKKLNILKSALLNIILPLKKVANTFHRLGRRDFLQVTDAPWEG